MRKIAIALLAGSLLSMPLAGCSGETSAEVPAPIAMTDDAVGHYCQMYVLDHGGPKAQIHLKGFEQPLWFAQVSDAVAYMHDKERTADVMAVYVSDMEKAVSWGEPGVENWVAAERAFFVTGSRQMGGMDTPEAIPFGTREAAEAFVEREGGGIVTFDAIPEDYVRPQAAMNIEGMPQQPMHGHGS